MKQKRKRDTVANSQKTANIKRCFFRTKILYFSTMKTMGNRREIFLLDGKNREMLENNVVN